MAFTLHVNDLGHGIINFTIVDPEASYTAGQCATMQEVYEVFERVQKQYRDRQAPRTFTVRPPKRF